MTVRSRLARLEKQLSPAVDQPWWYDIEDHVEQGPGIIILAGEVDRLRGIIGLEPIGELRRRWAGLAPLDDGREDKIGAFTGSEINAMAAALGWPRVPLGDIVEDESCGHGYMWSKHSRPILCLAFVVLVATITEEETATADAVVLGWERRP